MREWCSLVVVCCTMYSLRLTSSLIKVNNVSLAGFSERLVFIGSNSRYLLESLCECGWTFLMIFSRHLKFKLQRAQVSRWLVWLFGTSYFTSPKHRPIASYSGAPFISIYFSCIFHYYLILSNTQSILLLFFPFYHLLKLRKMYKYNVCKPLSGLTPKQRKFSSILVSSPLPRHQIFLTTSHWKREEVKEGRSYTVLSTLLYTVCDCHTLTTRIHRSRLVHIMSLPFWPVCSHLETKPDSELVQFSSLSAKSTTHRISFPESAKKISFLPASNQSLHQAIVGIPGSTQ